MSIAILCPRDNLGGFVSDASKSVVLRHQATGVQQRMSIGSVVSRFPDSTFTDAASQDDAIKQLGEARERSASLDFSLMLMDGELPLEVRQKAAQVLSELLAKPENLEYVLDLVLASPLPPDADTEGARKATADSTKASELVTLMIECDSRSQSASNA